CLTAAQRRRCGRRSPLKRGQINFQRTPDLGIQGQHLLAIVLASVAVGQVSLQLRCDRVRIGSDQLACLLAVHGISSAGMAPGEEATPYISRSLLRARKSRVSTV